MAVIIVGILVVVSLGIYMVNSGRYPDTIATEQASEAEESEESTTEETTEEEASTEEEEETSESASVVYPESSPVAQVPQANPVAQVPQGSPGLTPQQQVNRRIYEERMATYDGTGPSPWVQGQIDWAREQGLLPAQQPTSLCHQDRSACDESQPGIQTEREMEEHWKASGLP